MLATILGLSLFLIPFLLIFCFKNRLVGFAYVLSSVIVTHLLIALTTQLLHIFLYPVIISIHAIIAVSVLAFIKYKAPIKSFKFKINWLVILGFLVILFQLWSVHFFYTGAASSFSGIQYLHNNSYPYPYFSDEWIGVSLSNYSINNNALPIINPLAADFKDNNFPNIFVCFFSLIAELFLVANIAPLFGYVFLSIILGVLICLLVFIFLKTKEVNNFIALITALFIPYIVSGANLPGIWYLIPFTVSVIIFLLSLISFSLKQNWLAVFTSFLAVLFYPPLIVFVIPILIIFLITNKELKNKEKIKIGIFGFLAILLSAIFIIYIQDNNVKILWKIFLSSFWRLSLDGGIPTLYIWRIVPFWLLPFSVIGLISSFIKKDFIISIITTIGLSLWLLYSFDSHYFFIDYARLVTLTSVLVVILFGLGINFLLEKILKKYPHQFHKNFISLFKWCILILFLLASLVYTTRTNWQSLLLQLNNSDRLVSPAAPANLYLQDDDLRLFKNISKERFLAIPWKGLVIGVATNNYPLHTKQSIVSNNYLNYNKFMASSCKDKVSSAKKYNLSYVYSEEFTCQEFLEIGQSSENIHLYKFNN